MSTSTEQLRAWYCEDRLPMATMAQRSGLTRQGIWKRLRLAGLLTPQTIRRAPSVTGTCAECGTVCQTPRWRMQHQRHQFCGSSCYRAWLSNPDYQQHRQGQRRARAIVREVFPLQPGQIVHHVNGHTDDNDLVNLMVFASNAEHLAWHHRNPSIHPLWRGDGQ